jgi:hypothetical protein
MPVAHGLIGPSIWSCQLYPFDPSMSFGSLTLIAAQTHLSVDQSHEVDAISTVMALAWLHPNALLFFRARKPLSARTFECTPSATGQSHACACAGTWRTRIRQFDLSLFAGSLPCYWTRLVSELAMGCIIPA